MYVKCVINDLSKLTDVPVAERLKEGIHIDGPITDLVIGEIYPVQAIEVHLDRGLWLYLHTVGQADLTGQRFRFYLDRVSDFNWTVVFFFSSCRSCGFRVSSSLVL